MYKYDYLKVSAITSKITLGNVQKNKAEILNSIKDLNSAIAITGELALTGVNAMDFFKDINFKEEINEGIKEFLEENKFLCFLFLGTPLYINDKLYNACLLIKGDEILNVTIKKNLSELEKRWFASEISETITLFGKEVPVSDEITLNGRDNINIKIVIGKNETYNYQNYDLIINLASDPKTKKDSILNKIEFLKNEYKLAYIYAGSSITDSSTLNILNNLKVISDLDTTSIKDELARETTILTSDIDIRKIKNSKNTKKSKIEFELKETNNFQFTNEIKKDVYSVTKEEAENIKDILIESVIHRLKTINTTKTVLGLSGGLDSSFALLILILAYKKYKINLNDIAILTLPSFATSNRTKTNVLKLKEIYNLNIEEINIKDEVELVLKKLNHEIKDTTYENVQARIRTSLLMDRANQIGGIVIGTADMSEIALGFSTYNADNMGMYNINANLPKTMIQSLFKHLTDTYFKEAIPTLDDILATPISPELSSEGQETEKIIGKYQINDFIMYQLLEVNARKERILFLLEEVFDLTKEMAMQYYKNFLKRMEQNQYKRQVLADSASITDHSIATRLSFITPSDFKRNA